MAEKSDAREYRIVINSRKSASIEGVENVESFDEDAIIMNTKMGMLVLKGSGLHIIQLDLEKGYLVAEGYCRNLDFVDEKKQQGRASGKSVWQRLLR